MEDEELIRDPGGRAYISEKDERRIKVMLDAMRRGDDLVMVCPDQASADRWTAIVRDAGIDLRLFRTILLPDFKATMLGAKGEEA